MIKNYIFTSLFSFGLSFLFCLIFIPLLKKLKAGQNILGYVKEHKQKSGTPTMGGLAFIFASSIISLIMQGIENRILVVSIVVGVAFLLVGFLDDYLKIKRKENLGLLPIQKIIFQLSVACMAALFCIWNGLTFFYVPFTTIKVDIGFRMFPLCAFVFLSAVNCVNLTDGLDGLAASSCVSYFLCIGIIIFLQGIYFPLAGLSFSLVGALFAYLIFNVNKASVFMGDTGSLSLGGFVACISIFSGNLFLVAILGFVFVLSGITVIIQVIYYKKTKKRVFLMAPIHHHFQEKGYTESKISYCYALLTLLIGTLSIVFLL